MAEAFVFDADSPLPQVSLNIDGAWKVTDYSPLRRRFRVGENRVIPGSPGRLWVDREWDEQVAPLPMKIFGRKDYSGNPWSDHFDGALENYNYLLDNVFNILDLRSGTFTDRLTDVWTGSVAVEDYDFSPDPNSGGDVLVGTVRLVVPAGWLTLTGS